MQRWCDRSKGETAYGCKGACDDCGLCTVRAGRCVAASKKDCRCSRLCMDRGFCSPADGICKALTDDDCRNSVGCRILGQCRARNGSCVLLGKADCEYPCAVFGNCSVNDDGYCRPSAAGCAESLACRVYQRCGFDGDGCTECKPGDPGCPSPRGDPDYWEANGYSGMHGAPPSPDIGRTDGLGDWCGYYAWPELDPVKGGVPGTRGWP
jgi:hypothetical protein